MINVSVVLAVPRLELSPSPTGATIFTRMVSINGYVLQTNASLSTTNWATQPNAPVTPGASNQIVLLTSAGARFCRLAPPKHVLNGVRFVAQI
jgi:hypothetical protein